jgi:HAE1 family hydrophobic/amphiphilic exporter-1
MGAQIIPTEAFEAKPLNFTLNEALRLARDNRPELKQTALQQDINRVEVDFARNQTKPQVDAFVTYGLTGVAGTPAQTVDQNGNVQTANVAQDFIGSYGTALGNLASNDYRTVRVGVNINLPFGNRSAKANLGRALATDHQLELQRQRQQLAIEIEVRNAMQAADMAQQRIGTSRTAREYAEQQLAGEEKKFSAGLSTTFLVLTRQTELAQARLTELRALTDYNKAVADLQKAIAATLESNDIRLKTQ